MHSRSDQRYIPIQLLAQGGMGRVELTARIDGEFERLYALKRLRPEVREDELVQRMFIEEATVAGRIRHPNVVSVLDVGEDEEGPFLVMDLVEGICAQDLLKWAAKEGVTLPVQLVLRIVNSVALGLHAAHELKDEQGRSLSVVHRDVSPQNILIGFDGTARIADFGVAKALDRASQTTTGILKGKAGYMSPEQLQFRELDRRSDIFALGIVMFELLASRRLYWAEGVAAAARRILEEPPPDIDEVREDVPPAVVALMFEMLAKDPSSRPASCVEVSKRVERCLAEVVDADGVIDVATYLQTHFAFEAAEVRQRSVDGLVKARGIRDRAARANYVPWLIAGGVAVLIASAGGAFLGSDGLRLFEGSSEVVSPLAEPQRAVQESPPVVPLSPPEVTPARVDEPSAAPELTEMEETTGLEDPPELADEGPEATPPRHGPRIPRGSGTKATGMDRLFDWDPTAE